MPNVTVGTENSAPIDLYYTDHGSGPPVVLIHGFPLSGTAWEKQIRPLLGLGYRTIAYDRRGFGSSDRPGIGYDYDTFAADLHTLMTELDLREAALVGHSMGTGEIARYLATYGSARVSKAVMISALPPYLCRTDDNPDGVERSDIEEFLDRVTEDRYAFQTSFLNSYFNWPRSRGPRVGKDVYQATWNLAAEASPIGTYECVKALMTDFRADVPHINVPLLIVHGTEDNVLPYAGTALRLREMVPDSQLVTVPEAPHALPWTHPAEVNQAMLEFLGVPAPVLAP